MDARQLMIGDWVDWYNSPFANPHYYDKVINLEKDDNVPCDPIPLTAEILEKNGWKKWRFDPQKIAGAEFMDAGFDNYYTVQKVVLDVQYRVTVNVQKFDGGKRLKFSIDSPVGHVRSYYFNHVHELQHALRLFGLSDLADNFKV